MNNALIKKQKLDKVASVKQKINFMNDFERPPSYIPSKPHDDELLKAATQSNVMKIKSNIDNKTERRKAIDTINEQCFDKKHKLDKVVSLKQKINFMNDPERPASHIPSKPNQKVEKYNDNTTPT